MGRLRASVFAAIWTGLACAAAAQTPLLFPEAPVNTFTTGGQRAASVAIDPAGDFVVVWQGQDGDSIGVKARRFDTFGAPLGDEFQVNTYTTAAQYSPRVATDASGNFVVVWSSYVQTGEEAGGIFGQRFDSAGAPVGGEFHVNTYTTGAQYQPAVAMNAAGRFVVAWSSAGQDGDGYGVFAQRYDPDGNVLGGEFQVNTTTTGHQYAPSVAMDTTGGFFVAWSGGPMGSSSYDVFGRRYGPAGNALGSEFQVNAQTGVDARLPSVATDNDGDAVVVWQQPDTDGTGVYGQRFDESGQPEALPFRANTHTAGNQSRPWAAFDQTHEFVVVWDGEGQDDPGAASGLGVFAQRFGDPNVPVGGEFPVNLFTAGGQSHPAVSMNASGNFAIAWESDDQDGSLLGIFSRRGEFHAARSMAVDAHGTGMTTSNLNGVLEANEAVQVEPTWQNTFAFDLPTSGTAQNLDGPPGAAYVIEDGTAGYGTITGGATADCLTAAGDCYVMAVLGTRQVAHWDATFSENLNGLITKTWSLHVGESFPDVPISHPFYAFIENLFHNGITGGCGGGSYCPDSSVTRAQMAVFLLKSEHGSAFAPPPCTGVFPDVACPSTFADWIEQLAAEGITGGCGGGNYCPDNPVTRQQMAVFLLKAKYGSTYVPAGCTGIFGDVPCPSQFADWIEELSNQGITGGCGGGNYCPTNPNTRGQMAVFLVKTFGLLLYGP